eukprot:CAMPEP_0117508536 /NCGR_PEP_ID=MMETSP0784-20121206/27002_1 /TAXON_ID=39447 /ORGANISM="" /LENGTH=589 /DNA_ID=CAMNT_0005304099 /DNA_START=37 /DNA_END=1807 /DNA_ORIENTATION=+
MNTLATLDHIAVTSLSKGLVVHACGRTVSIPPDQAATLQDLQSALQYSLSVRQNFDIFDPSGHKLATDAELCRAVGSGNNTLTATLPDVSIHSIEDRREELAQMQWKLIRDQNHQTSSGLAMLTRQVANVEAQLEQEKKERSGVLERFKKEMQVALEAASAEVLREVRHVEEQVAGVASVLKSERNMREVTVERQSSEMQLIRETIDAHRDTTGQMVARSMEKVDQHGQQLGRERAMREALEDRMKTQVDDTALLVDKMTDNMRQLMTEYQGNFNKNTAEIHDKIDQHGRHNLKLKTELDISQQDAENKVALLDDRCRCLESRVAELMQRNAESIEMISRRSEHVSQSVEMLRAETGKQMTACHFLIEQKAQDVEPMVAAVTSELNERLANDRAQRHSQLRAFKDSVMAEQGQHLSQLENRVHSRFERESAAREFSTKELMTEFRRDKQDQFSRSDMGPLAVMDTCNASLPDSDCLPVHSPAPQSARGHKNFSSVDLAAGGRSQQYAHSVQGGSISMMASPRIAKTVRSVSQSQRTPSMMGSTISPGLHSRNVRQVYTPAGPQRVLTSSMVSLHPDDRLRNLDALKRLF